MKATAKRWRWVGILWCLGWLSGALSAGAAKDRLIILADMGNEPDEEQQMVHMVMCCNEFELEGLIAVTGKYLQPASRDPYRRVLHPELFHGIIDAYAQVVDNLRLHADGWPEPKHLRSLVVSGQPDYGIAGVGEGKSTPGSELILKAALREDPRPLWVVVNAGSSTLAQALRDYRATHTPAEVDALVARLRVFENGAQDNAGAWICAEFPAIHWIRSNYQTYCYGGPSNDGLVDNRGNRANLGPYTWEPYAYSGLGQHQWALEHIKGDHGPMGRAWPLRQFGNGRIHFLEGGGTIPWLGLVNRGLFSIDFPHWGGWSGRFSREKVENYWSKHTSVKVDEEKVAPFSVYKEASDRWVNPEDGAVFENIFTPVWRWRRAFFNNFVCRMDWCQKPYQDANHHPVAAVGDDREDTILFLSARPGEVLELDASATEDPDGDPVEISWWIYPEAGTYAGDVAIVEPTRARTSLTVPNDAQGAEIHLVLEVKDQNPIASLYDYRRIVIRVP